jgi:hypothetical protein
MFNHALSLAGKTAPYLFLAAALALGTGCLASPDEASVDMRYAQEFNVEGDRLVAPGDVDEPGHEVDDSTDAVHLRPITAPDRIVDFPVPVPQEPEPPEAEDPNEDLNIGYPIGFEDKVPPGSGGSPTTP